MKTVKTRSGFEVDIDAAVLDDMELVDALAELEDNPLAFSRVITMILGDEKKRLYDHIKKTRKSDRVSVTAMSEEIEDILNGLNSKN